MSIVRQVAYNYDKLVYKIVISYLKYMAYFDNKRLILSPALCSAGPPGLAFYFLRHHNKAVNASGGTRFH